MLVPRRILLGEISSYKAIVIARFLKINYPDIFIITYDYYRFTKFIHTKYSDKHLRLKVTPKNTQEYLLELSSIIKENTIDIFIPVHSDTIDPILMNKNLFECTLDYLGDYNDYLQLHKKNSLMQLAKELSIKIPKNYQVLNQAILPCVAKPLNLSSSKGVIYLKNKKDLDKFKSKTRENYIYQELIEGVGCGYSVYCKKGEILKEYGHMRLAEFPVSGGSSVYRTGYSHPMMKITTEKILKEVNWTGFAMFEYKVTSSDELVLIEVNPRIWGSINQALSNGVNLFEPILCGNTIEKDQKTNKNTYLSPQVYFAFLLYLINGKIKPIFKFLINFNRNKADVNLFIDWRAWVSVILRNFV